MSRKRILRAILPAALLAASVAAAAAACRQDLVASAQTLQRSREAMEGAAKGNATAQCDAYRRHVASLKQVRTVFARCDTGANKAKNDAQVGATIAAVTQKAQLACKK